MRKHSEKENKTLLIETFVNYLGDTGSRIKKDMHQQVDRIHQLDLPEQELSKDLLMTASIQKYARQIMEDLTKEHALLDASSHPALLSPSVKKHKEKLSLELNSLKNIVEICKEINDTGKTTKDFIGKYLGVDNITKEHKKNLMKIYDRC